MGILKRKLPLHKLAVGLPMAVSFISLVSSLSATYKQLPIEWSSKATKTPQTKTAHKININNVNLPLEKGADTINILGHKFKVEKSYFSSEYEPLDDVMKEELFNTERTRDEKISKGFITQIKTSFKEFNQFIADNLLKTTLSESEKEFINDLHDKFKILKMNLDEKSNPSVELIFENDYYVVNYEEYDTEEVLDHIEEYHGDFIYHTETIWTWQSKTFQAPDRLKNASRMTLSIKGDYYQPFRNSEQIEKDWSFIKNELLKNTDLIKIKSEIGGDLYTTVNKAGFRSNIDMLEDKISNFNKKLSDIGAKLRLKYRVKGNNNINVIVINNENNETKLFAENIRIIIEASENIDQYNIDERIKINLGKWVDFNTNTTELVDDVLVRDPEDKTKIGKINSKEFWGGRWIAHTPLKIIFNTSLKENEVLLVNGKKVDVIDRQFSKILLDGRNDSADNSFSVDSQSGDRFQKNEYKIEIYQYKGSNNLEENLTLKYTKIIVVDSLSSQIDFKWYGWDPSANNSQAQLISEYLIDSNGKRIRDEKGKLIKNEKYDPSIDPITGTKKELVLLDFNHYLKKSMFTDGNYKDFSYLYSNYQEKKYYQQTKLPYKAKTLFVPNSKETLDRGVIAEAIVLGKGGLKQLIGKSENFLLFKLVQKNNILQFENFDNKPFKEEILQTSDNSYFSNSGIWLFVSNSHNSISNFKLVLIKENTEPSSNFTDNVALTSGQIVPLWKSKQGAHFRDYLYSQNIKDKEIDKLNYQQTMEHYKRYVNYLFWRSNSSQYIPITPLPTHIKDNLFTTSSFLSKYKSDLNLAKKELLDEFKYKDKVEIQGVELSRDNQGYIIKIRPKSLNDNFKLTSNEIFVPLKFSDVDYKNVENINIKLNTEYLHLLFTENSLDEFETKIIQNIDQVLKTEKSVSLANLFHIYTFLDKVNNVLNIQLKVKDGKNIRAFPSNKFQFYLKNNQQGISFKTQQKHLFLNKKINNIHLNGLTEVKKIKEFITKQITNDLAPLTNEDFIIKNLDQVAKERQTPNTPAKNEYNPHSILIVEAKKGAGILFAKVYNSASNIFEKEVDLSKIEFESFSFNEDNAELIKPILDKFIVERIAKLHNLRLNQDIKIDNYDIGLWKLSKGGGESFTFTISGINRKLVNRGVFKITNHASKVVYSKNENTVLDLTKITGKQFNYAESQKSILRLNIVRDIVNYFENEFKLIFNVDYHISADELDNLTNKLTASPNQFFKEKIEINAFGKYVKNSATLWFSNKSGERIINDLKPIKITDILTKLNIKQHKTKSTNTKFLLSIIIPSIVGIALTTIIVVWAVKTRYYDKKIK
ncbi:hypothetical protein MCFN_01640 [Mycoplasmopsis californica]|uniref:Uncharacterized protein n=1 Tax=Mycoplasmopsis californica TaxID=2113 RepID=A0A059XW50_9BACT|nr:hypothetical protein [Mycoplasmopsis californica]AIA29472.1 hypothetical protein MCFN_01640 [Mycoplasmopsis californica]